jgi:phage-related minor tail protein
MASKVIKGLTVEIAGDTTKLGKALDGVETKSRNLSKELGEVNRLLKMDPGNTELLAQKQKVLSEAIANTAKKLDKLKQAE